MSMMDNNDEEDEPLRPVGGARVRVKKLGKLAMKTAKATRATKAGGKGGKPGKGKGGKKGRSRIGNLAAFWPGSKGARALCPAYNSKRGCRKRNCRGLEHACGYIVSEDGSICGRTDCSYWAHE